jgi:hypothetical protein
MAKSAYTYQVTLTPIGTPKEDLAPRPPLSFAVSNHDDIIGIVERARAASGLAPDAATAMAVGLKLLGEVALQERDNPLFAPLHTGLRDFILGLKSRLRG